MMDYPNPKGLEDMNLGPVEILSDDVPRYNYQPLDGPDNIRTLELHPTKDRLECSIRQIGVSEGGYQALSYVWGDPEMPYRAIVRGANGEVLGYIALTANLKNALGDLRDTEGLTSKVFWVDQICINQKGDEKNQQVAMMGAIYENAARVITYLGPAKDDEEEKAGMDLMQHLHKHFEENYKMLFELRGMGEARQRRSEFPVTRLPRELQDDEHEEGMKLKSEADGPYVFRGWRRLCEVAFGEWTQRLWIVQEQILNREAVMLRGTLLLPWDAVATMSLLFDTLSLPYKYCRRFWRENCSQRLLTPLDIAASTYAMWYDRRKNALITQRENNSVMLMDTILTNMAFYEDLECRDPRDRIFALIAISSDAEELGIVPDYSASRTASHVFLDLSTRILQSCTNLKLLAYACSWANKSSDVLPSMGTQCSSIFNPSESSPKILAPHPRTSLEVPPRLILSRSVLVLKGLIIDYIVMPALPSVSNPSFELGVLDFDYLSVVDHVLSNWSAILFHLGITLETAASLCRAIMANAPTWSPILHERRLPAEQTVFHLWSLYRHYFSLIRDNLIDFVVEASKLESFEAVLQKLAGLLNNAIDVDNLDPEVDEARDEVFQYQIVKGRSFSATKQGFVCNGMHEVKPGDAIAAFQGGDRLFILRPVGDKYRLIGDAYVHGLMLGEAYQGLDPDDVDYDIEIV